jgi:hypothetical protein
MSETKTRPAELPRYTLRQSAAIAKCCYETVWRAVRNGDLPATRRGANGRYLVKENDLLAWAFPKAGKR